MVRSGLEMSGQKKKPGRSTYRSKQNIVQLAEELSKITHFSFVNETQLIHHLAAVQKRLPVCKLDLFCVRKSVISELIEAIEQVKVSKRECESILHMNPLKEKLFDRTSFRDILHVSFNMTDDMLMDRVFRAFDKDNDSYVSCNEWVEGLSVFLKGTLDEKMKYCFDVYDLNNDSYISREEMFHMLKNSLVKPPTEEDPDEGVKDLVEITLKKLDKDHDGKVSYQDFKTSVEEESALLEVFGQCLPSPQRRTAFLEFINEKSSGH